MTSDHVRSHVRAVWVAHAIELTEESGPLDDEQAMAQAFRMHTGQQERLLERAWILGQKLGLDREIERWRGLQWPVGIALCLIVYLIWGGLIAPFARPDRPINTLIALASVLLVPSVIFALWLAMVVRQVFSTASSGTFINAQALFVLLAWLPGGKKANNGYLAQSALVVLQKNRLATWFSGLLSHGLWSVVLLLVLITLRILFFGEGYDLYWKSTTDKPASVESWVRAFGQFPALLGFPTIESVPLNAMASQEQTIASAWWLMGCIFAYGLLPRLSAFAICWWILRVRKGQLQLDTQDPYFRKILARFDAMEATPSEDPETPSTVVSNLPRMTRGPVQRLKFVVIGFELPDEYPWPPPVGGQADLMRLVSGSFDERRAVLNEIASTLPRCALIACDVASSPDRGTERFIREVCGYVDQVGVLLMASKSGSDEYPMRWADWLATLELKNLRCLENEEQTLHWLDESHGKTH